MLLLIGLKESCFLGQKVTGIQFIHREVHLFVYKCFRGMVTLRKLAVSVFFYDHEIDVD